MALAATESGGVHPRAIATRLAGGRLDGARALRHPGRRLPGGGGHRQRGGGEGRNRLAAVLVLLDRAGVSLEPLPPTAFAPEVPHAAISFRAVAVSRRSPRRLRRPTSLPFRTVEDIHVMAAIPAWLAAVFTRTPAGTAHVEELAALAAAGR